jgi:hypothetical protein
MTRSPRPLGRATTVALTALLAAGVLALAPAAPAGAAGVTTHAWMSAEAIDKVTSPQLKALLVANKDYVRSGSHFPDSGYALTNTYGEEAHWQRFHDAYAQQIIDKPGCGNLAAAKGPCAPMVAFLMGMIGHGVGDEVWDWLFEPNVADLEEYFTPSTLGGQANEGGAELQLDLVAIADFGQPTTKLVAFPSHPDIIAAFDDIGVDDIDEDQLNLGQVAMDVVHQAEAAWAPGHIDALHREMPWTSRNMVTAPGGVEFAATAIAGEWNAMWGRLLGAQPPTSVSITYPADGQRRVPATGWTFDPQPGSARGRGGAKTRIAAVLTYARPYIGSAGSVTDQLPAGSMTLAERDTGTPIAMRSGWPRSVPYGPNAGAHTISTQPATELAPCTWYTAGVTANLVDARNQPVTPMTWDFRTGADAAGNRCADDPYTPDEKFVRKVTSDLLDREATEQELQSATYAFERGRTRRTFTSDTLGSTEERQLLVTRSFERYLGRGTDPSGLAYWANKLKTITVPDLSARLLGSDEVYRKAGSTNRGYVSALYPLVHGRDVDPSGLAYWTKKLDQGLDRGKLAKMLLTSHESARRTVAESYQDLLGRSPDPSGWAHWTAVLQRAGDPRTLWLSLISSSEYDRKAQAA